MGATIKRLGPWVVPWIASATCGFVVFGLFHQVLVDWAPVVFVGVPVAIVLSIPLVVAFAKVRREPGLASGLLFGLVVFAGFVSHYALTTVAMWDRTFDDGPRGGWQIAATLAAPALSGWLCWQRWRSTGGAVWMVFGVLLLAFGVGGFQETEVDWRNFGALVSMLPATAAAGWVLARLSGASALSPSNQPVRSPPLTH
jgi:hypothetical protein